MTPLSHTTHTSPTAPEQAGDNVELPIATVSTGILVHNLFPYLGPSDLRHVGQACHWFRDASRRVWQQRVQEICRTCAELLPSFGSTTPGDDPTPEETAAFLNRTVQRVKQINDSLPTGLRSQFSTKDLVCKVGPGHMREFLQKAYDHSLRTVFGDLVHVPEDASLEESVRQIREWLQTAEAGQTQKLYCEYRELCCLPGEIGQLTALQRLNLGGTQLSSLPPEIGQLTALQRLDLGWNYLTSLPPEIGQLTALRKLVLDGNQLKTLPPEIGQLTALQALRLGSNQLKTLPPEIGRLTALQNLWLLNNQLLALPPEIGQMTALNWLILSNNRLTSLPPEIGQMTALHELHLSDNRFTSLPPEIGRLTALQWLFLV